jgi:hypothetical protein
LGRRALRAAALLDAYESEPFLTETADHHAILDEREMGREPLCFRVGVAACEPRGNLRLLLHERASLSSSSSAMKFQSAYG